MCTSFGLVIYPIGQPDPSINTKTYQVSTIRQPPEYVRASYSYPKLHTPPLPPLADSPPL